LRRCQEIANAGGLGQNILLPVHRARVYHAALEARVR
jgi:hypothetical protein